MDDIVNIVSNLGFPIAMCILIFWYMNKERETFSGISDEIKEIKTMLETLIDYKGKGNETAEKEEENGEKVKKDDIQSENNTASNNG